MKNKVLKALNYLAGFIFLLSASALDSDTNVPAYICAGCGVWFFLMILANREVLFDER